MTELTAAQHRTLCARLQEPGRYPHPVSQVTTVRTHISTLLLTERYAYKLKQPLDLGFLDFTTLAQRRHACDEELRLNRRLAPELYLQRIAITGTPDDPVINGDGPLLDWAVQMRRFDDRRLLDNLLAQGELRSGMLDDIAAQLAAFHEQAAVAGHDSPLGTPDAVAEPARDNLASLTEQLGNDGRVTHLRDWTEQQITALTPLMADRHAGGHVRECHGDLHLGNIVAIDDRPVIFDGIEFSEALRWIDTINEVAFLDMDLRSRGRPELAARFTNIYLEHTGDYNAVGLLPFYRVYRALVRAKINALRLQDADAATRETAREAVDRYLAVAAEDTRAPTPGLFLMHGLSGSGKSTVATAIVERTGAIRLRSDVERKRLHAMDRAARTGAGVGEGIYDSTASERTYQRLEALAAALLRAGADVVVDAATLRRGERDRFRRLAATVGVPFTLVDCRADEAELRRRIIDRQRTGRDPSEADTSVLDHQLRTAERPGADEEADVLVVDTAQDPGFAALDAVTARETPAG
ncbi:bifunctional aminoglycoside phosphotransferase/ATP-binding protein [Aquisalimonas sp.]|uniref:bifunctional aminoglycoside phosphotransferase/ATP-binding protein n=1 Tax=unclassified Aquisalimonas TaxID=2644645 RepID=UPI0025C1B11A|nr:bifunctional aminoglycoside phosphotransferase/ATP-binding protein [Aquisalimonas sp.]